jgi:hypothetical protein
LAEAKYSRGCFSLPDLGTAGSIGLTIIRSSLAAGFCCWIKNDDTDRKS